MLDFFVILTKNGLVLFATVNQSVENGVVNLLNKLIKHVILEERTEQYYSQQNSRLAIQYRLDNEFELVFVVGYQKILSLSYIDKFLDDIQLAFRDKFNDYDLRKLLLTNITKKTANNKLDLKQEINLLNLYNVVNFQNEFNRIYQKCASQKPQNQKEMKSYQESVKSQKTVGSMIIKKEKTEVKDKKKEQKEKEKIKNDDKINDKINEEVIDEEPKLIAPEMLKKLNPKGPTSPKVSKPKNNNKNQEKKTKAKRQWDLQGKNDENLDFSKKHDEQNGHKNGFTSSVIKNIESDINYDEDMNPDLNLEVSDEEEEEQEEEKEDEKPKRSLFGSLLKTFQYNKALTKADLDPILAQLRDHLISKNVASEIAVKLCESVSNKLEGQHVNTWIGLKSFVRQSLEDSILTILSPNRNINILRDVNAKSTQGSPYVIVFCGVNGVGKSTNLAKISNWLIVNGIRVLVIACDTFRAGAIEQLRTHITALKAIHEKGSGKSKIDLFEKGYGKDSAAIAMEGINYARSAGYNCCLVDTAGRMQDNEPLMKQLAKLIKINEPDMTLFVGEALVGNEAVDQLTKFNTALLDNGCRGTTSSNSSAINGIVLTKFDTIDDQVGAAISMTYITGQPIVFVGVGQTYRDLKQLNAKAVVKALMK